MAEGLSNELCQSTTAQFYILKNHILNGLHTNAYIYDIQGCAVKVIRNGTI